MYLKPPVADTVCDFDQTVLEQRADDTEAVFAERMRAYAEQTAPVLEHYRELGRFAEVDGDAPVDVVTEQYPGGRGALRTDTAEPSRKREANHGDRDQDREGSGEDAPRRRDRARGTSDGAGHGEAGRDHARARERRGEADRGAGAKPAFKGYHGFPCVLCTSLNEQVVHGIPSAKTVLRDGDILSVDCGVVIDGYYGDSAITIPVGKVAAETQRLLDVTKASLEKAIDTVRPGAMLGDVGAAVQEMVEAEGFSVVKEFVGHGIGTHMHEDPRSRISVSAGVGCGCARAWCWRSSPW